MTAPGEADLPARVSEELSRYHAHYKRQKSRWMRRHYVTKATIVVLAASIPVMTTIDTWPWVIAVAGALIAVLEGMAQLWGFHDRYVAARVLYRGMERERLLYCCAADKYAVPDLLRRDKLLVKRLTSLIETYDMQVIDVLQDSRPERGGDRRRVKE